MCVWLRQYVGCSEVTPVGEVQLQEILRAPGHANPHAYWQWYKGGFFEVKHCQDLYKDVFFKELKVNPNHPKHFPNALWLNPVLLGGC